MNIGFAPIGNSQTKLGGENSFWPSFTDIMMVITMIFLMTTSLLIVRHWQLVSQLQQSLAAEQIASQIIESTSAENATLDERLADAQQNNSILRLQLLQKEDDKRQQKARFDEQRFALSTLADKARETQKQLQQKSAQVTAGEQQLATAIKHQQTLTQQASNLSQSLNESRQISLTSKQQLLAAQTEIKILNSSNQDYQIDINLLDSEKSALNRQIEKYNQQLLSLKGDYETVKSKYQKLIKPARTAKGKYIAEIIYIKSDGKKIIRFKLPGDTSYTNLKLEKLEQHLGRLKADKGNKLYVKIIIPEDSGLTYNEAWTFMRTLLVKYDYYHQQ